jgi:pimeloyl-ACP methyl ester carboxylesterase
MSDDVVEFVESSNGVRVALHDLGGPSDDSSVPVLLFSHATGFHARVWEPMAAFLRDRFRCLALDVRGHGLSELPPGVGLAWSGMADDVLAVVGSDALPAGPLHGIGHSMGGAALVMAAGRRPHLFRSLWLYEPVIFPTGGFPTGGIPTANGENPMSAAATRRRARFESYEEAYENFRSKPPLNQLHPDGLRAYVDGGFAAQEDGSVMLRCRPDTEAEVFRQASASDAWDHVSTLQIPVAIVAGRPGDPGPGAFAPTTAAALPLGTLVERPRLGHFGPLEDPAGMAEDVAAWVRAHP